MLSRQPLAPHLTMIFINIADIWTEVDTIVYSNKIYTAGQLLIISLKPWRHHDVIIEENGIICLLLAISQFFLIGPFIMPLRYIKRHQKVKIRHMNSIQAHYLYRLFMIYLHQFVIITFKPLINDGNTPKSLKLFVKIRREPNLAIKGYLWHLLSFDFKIVV